MRLREGNIEWVKLVPAIVLILIGISFILYALPGQGKNIPNAIGLALTFAGVAWAYFMRGKSDK